MFGWLNPFTFGRKARAAWNILMACQTFHSLSANDKRRVLVRIVEIEGEVKGYEETIDKIYTRITCDQFYLLMTLAMMSLHITPVLGDELWHEVKNPNFDGRGAEKIIHSAKRGLEREFGMELEDPFKKPPLSELLVEQPDQ